MIAKIAPLHFLGEWAWIIFFNHYVRLPLIPCSNRNISLLVFRCVFEKRDNEINYYTPDLTPKSFKNVEPQEH